jgi:hypothetical protein
VGKGFYYGDMDAPPGPGHAVGERLILRLHWLASVRVGGLPALGLLLASPLGRRGDPRVRVHGCQAVWRRAPLSTPQEPPPASSPRPTMCSTTPARPSAS